MSGFATAASDHATLLAQVKVPVLFTHHVHVVDPDNGTVVGTIPDLQVKQVEELVTGAGNSFTYKPFPTMPHSMHGDAPDIYAATVIDWVDGLYVHN
ncbi:hypothetical protein [Arthrobacter cryoconiti]|uniref:CBS domain-containing protein n=1 Tax=Arthrobacter cryoconiti TaxID=748907 RepID=A0ABV8QYF8_9MICC|nr:hypothetical protein [Arthrobacter cryoconiti]MCC9067542.1 hypothetical protein [Arthrobacter cryoconiti]